MRDTTTLINQCKQLRADAKDMEEITHYLRAQGCSKVEFIAILAQSLSISLTEAKELVRMSNTWSDVRERDDQFHASIDDDNLEDKDV